MTADELWWHVWTKIRFAGFKASYVNEFDIPTLTPFFKDFRVLTDPEWRFDPTGEAHGTIVREFLGKTGRFAGLKYVALKPKLRKILRAAAFFQNSPPGSPALAVLFGDDYDKPGDEALWEAHDRCAELVGYTTTLHIMMDIGFSCVKPDIWMVRLMCRLGWIEDALPAASPETAIKKSYQKPRIAEAVISRARQVANEMHPWHPEAPLREFDAFMVKYGQKPEGTWGIVRSLHEHWHPVGEIMDWLAPLSWEHTGVSTQAFR